MQKSWVDYSKASYDDCKNAYGLQSGHACTIKFSTTQTIESRDFQRKAIICCFDNQNAFLFQNNTEDLHNFNTNLITCDFVPAESNES